MFDIGGLELLVVAVLLIVVVGPKELPGMLRTFGRAMSKVRGMAAEFRGQFDDALREAELDEVRKAASDLGKLNPKTAMQEAMKPFKDAGAGLKRDLDGDGDGRKPGTDFEAGPEAEGPSAAPPTYSTKRSSVPFDAPEPMPSALDDTPPSFAEPVVSGQRPNGGEPRRDGAKADAAAARAE